MSGLAFLAMGLALVSLLFSGVSVFFALKAEKAINRLFARYD